MIRGLLVFGIGVYTGMYIAQNYEIKQLDDPSTLLNKFVAAVEEQSRKGSAGK